MKMIPMSKSTRLILLIVFVIFVAIVSYKIMHLRKAASNTANPSANVVYVSTIIAKEADWQAQFSATGNLRATVGVNVTTELAGMIREIRFTPGASVKKGMLLVQLDIDADLATLHVLEANAEIAKITYNRDTAQYKIHAVSKQVVDTDSANLKSAQAQVERQHALIEQKTIRAPFSGRLGISAVNPGQYLNPGDKITMLQTLDPMYVDFFVPQQAMGAIRTGQLVTMTVDAFPNKLFKGKITTIDPGVDPSVRNVQVEATLPNPAMNLTPGMFAYVVVDTGAPTKCLVLPQTAISFYPYGNTVYLIKESGKDANGKPILIAKQKFVTLGAKRGDQVVILKGVKVGEQVVTSGQLKLQNGSQVAINNEVVPTNEANPTPTDE